MCMQCIAKAEYVLKEDAPEFLPGYTLMIATVSNEIWKDRWDKGEIGLVVMNDPSCVGKFTINTKLVGLDYDSFTDNCFASSCIEHEFYDMIALTGWHLINSAIKAGYNEEEHGSFEYWFAHRLHSFYEHFTDTAKELMTV